MTVLFLLAVKFPCQRPSMFLSFHKPCGSPSCIDFFPKQGLGLPRLEGYKSHTLRGVELSAIGDFGLECVDF